MILLPYETSKSSLVVLYGQKVFDSVTNNPVTNFMNILLVALIKNFDAKLEPVYQKI